MPSLTSITKALIVAPVDQLRRLHSRPQPVNVVNDDIVDPCERFEEAAAYYGADVDALKKAAWRRFALWFMGSAILLSAAIAKAGEIASAPFGFVAYLTAFTFLPPLLALTIKAAFDHWQLRTRRLGSFREFLWLPGQWWPAESAAPLARRRGCGAVLIVAAALLTLIPGQVEAQLPPPPTTSTASTSTAAASTSATTTNSSAKSDTFSLDIQGQAAKFLLAVGGKGATGITSWIQTPSAVTTAIQALSVFLLAYGTALFAYNIIHGIADAAHTGAVLGGKGGGKWHQIWTPVRGFIGISLLVPAFGSGLSGVHVLVFIAAALGSTLADNIATQYVKSVITGEASPTIDASMFGVPEAGGTVVKRFLQLEACQQVYVYQAEQLTATSSDASNAGAIARRWIPAQPPVGGSKSDTVQVWDYGICGKLTAAAVTATGGSDQTYQQARVAALSDALKAVRDSGLPAQLARSSLTDGSTTISMGEQPWPSAIVAPLTQAAKVYEEAMTKAAAAALNSKAKAAHDAIVNDVSKVGWMGLGLFRGALAQAHAQVTALADAPVGYSPPRRTVGASFGASKWPLLVVQKIEEDWAQQASIQIINGNDLAAPGDDGANILTKILAPTSRRVAQAVASLSAAATSGADPLEALQNFGHLLLDGVYAGIVASIGIAAVATNSISGALGGLGAFLAAAPWAFLMLAAIVVVGAYNAYVLPLLPYLAVLYLAIGWVTLVLTAMIEAPLWAVSFIHPEGDSFVGQRQKPGVDMLLSILFRPALGVIAYIACVPLASLVVGFINLTFGAAFAGQQGGHVVGIIGWIASLLMSAVVIHKAVVHVYDIIHRIPDIASRQWGGSPDHHGSEARENTRNVIGIVDTKLSSTTQQGLRSVLPAPKDPTGSPNKLPKSAPRGRAGGTQQTVTP